MAEEDQVLETSGNKQPPVDLILEELHQAQSDASSYYGRLQQARNWTQCIWPGQTTDGRCHADVGNACWPWENASDSRLRTVQTFVNEHVNFSKYTFWQSKIQVKSTRPIVSGRTRNVAQRALEWRVYTHMRSELLRELPLAYQWRFEGGLAFMSIQWELQRRVDEQTISLPMLDQLAQQSRDDMAAAIVDVISDESQEDAAVAFLQQVSSILTKPQARKIVTDLRELKTVQLPTAYPFINKPVWEAKRPTIDILFPSETSDIQRGRFMDLLEPIDEASLRDRIVTEGYNKAFVDKACEHKGEPSEIMQQAPNWMQSNRYSGYWGTNWSSDRDLILLHHFHYKILDNGVPCVYKLVFNEQATKRNGSEPLYAWFGKLPYSHGQYPVVAMRREHSDRPLLSSRGIPEEAYTDELDIKAQQDGLTNRTDVMLNPPMIVPPMRVNAIKGSWKPRGVLGARPNEITWPNLPPMDATPVQIIQMVMQRLERRYPLFGVEVDPELKMVYKSQLSSELLGEIELCLEQTLQLMQQRELPADIIAVAGPSGEGFNVDPAEIQGKHTITATIDPRMLDPQYAAEKLGLLQQLMAFKQEGLLFKMGVEIIDPDMADLIEDDQMSPQAMEREKNDELNAINMAMNGIDPPFPIMGNHAFRLQTLIQNTLQNPNPAFQQRLASLPDTQEILKNRAKQFQNQIQQYQTNPTIGRTLATSAFNKQVPAQLTTGQPQ